MNPHTAFDERLDSALDWQQRAVIVAMAHADFNTAKDAQAAHNASKLMSDTLVMAVKHSVYDHLEQLIIEKLELATKSNGDNTEWN